MQKRIKEALIDARPMIIFFIIYMACFTAIEKIPRDHYFLLHTSADELIPFCEYFIIPYLLWFPFILFSILYLLFSDRMIYEKTSKALMIGMTVFIIISALFPTKQDLRPIMMGGNVFADMVANLYWTDTPTNIFPSLHVYNTICVCAGLEESRINPYIIRLVRILSVMIILSTLLLKQHSIVDVIGAFVMYEAVYNAVTYSVEGKRLVPIRR